MKIYETSKIRNIALIGHKGAGKTTLTEAILLAAGKTKRMGSIENGNTVSDFDQEEIRRKISVRTSLIPIEWEGYKLNLLDSPGYFDFAGEVDEALRAADSVVIVIKKSQGVEAGTEKTWEYASQAGLAKMLFITGTDEENTDLGMLIADCRSKLSDTILPPPSFFESGDESVKTMLVEAVAEIDEELMEKYLSDEEITKQAFEKAYKKGVASGQIVPVFSGSSLSGEGIKRLINAMVSLLPAPQNQDMKEEKRTSLFVFKTLSDPLMGKFSFFKVMTGKLRPDTPLCISRSGAERLSHLYLFCGKETEEVSMLCQGDLGAAARLKNVETGDTLTEKGLDITYAPIRYREGNVKKAIFPEGKGDEEKMTQSLNRLMAEDHTFKIEINRETHETIISAIGEQQLDVIVSALKNKFKVGVCLKNPTTPYRETIKGRSSVRGRHKKQSGGHGQYGDVVMAFEPSGNLEMPFVFEEKIFGGAVPKQYFPAVEKGIEEGVKKGVLAGYPVVGVKAVLVDGSYHPVDSSEMAFKMAASLAFREGVARAVPVILEPVAKAEILIPEEYTGDIMGDMKKHRGRLIEVKRSGKKQMIIAELPLEELYTYATTLRSITQGRGELNYHFVRYEEAPADIQQKVIEKRG